MRLTFQLYGAVLLLTVSAFASAQEGPPAPHASDPNHAVPTTSTPPPQLSAGGLSAPAPLDPQTRAAAQQNETERTLEKAKEKDSGRGLSWFWLDVEGGYQFVSLEAFEADTSTLTAGFVSKEASGGFVGAALGIQLLFITLGPRFRLGFFEDWQVLSIGGEAGLRFPLGPIEPHVSLGAGYTALGNVSGIIDVVDEAINIRGLDVRVDGGIDFFLGDVFSIGGGASWEFLALTRPGVSLDDLNGQSPQNVDEAQQTALAADGSAYGTAVSIYGKLGFHF